MGDGLVAPDKGWEGQTFHGKLGGLTTNLLTPPNRCTRLMGNTRFGAGREEPEDGHEALVGIWHSCLGGEHPCCYCGALGTLPVLQMTTKNLTDLWLVDRTRLTKGAGCEYSRFLAFHGGPNGTGLSVKGRYIPLATGTHIHSILAGLLGVGTTYGTISREYQDQGRKVIAEVVKGYLKETSPFLDANPEATEQAFIAKEQAWLVECLGWVLLLHAVPKLLEEWEVVEVEGEALGVVDGWLGIMSRPDLVLRSRADQTLAVVDAKSTDDPYDQEFITDWDCNPQLTIATWALEEKLGESIPWYYILGIAKGQRRATYNPETQGYTGPKRQATPLCYAYHKPGCPPLEAEEWKFHGEWWEDGRKRKVGKDFTKVPVWESGLTAEEWVKKFSVEELARMTHLIGPITTPKGMTEEFLAALKVQEERWREGIWQLYLDPGLNPKVLFRQSWQCKSYKRRCEFYSHCRGDAGGLDHFIDREPHHPTEVEQWRLLAGE